MKNINNPKRKDTIIKKLNYITNNYTAIKSMLNLKIGSSMESHILLLLSSLQDLKAELLEFVSHEASREIS